MTATISISTATQEKDYSSYSVIISQDEANAVLSIPCSGQTVAQTVKKHLFRLFPQADITVSRYADKDMPGFYTSSKAQVTCPTIEDELDKDLFDF